MAEIDICKPVRRMLIFKISERVASDLGLGGGFCRAVRIPPLLITG